MSGLTKQQVLACDYELSVAILSSVSGPGSSIHKTMRQNDVVSLISDYPGDSNTRQIESVTRIRIFPFLTTNKLLEGCQGFISIFYTVYAMLQVEEKWLQITYYCDLAMASVGEAATPRSG